MSQVFAGVDQGVRNVTNNLWNRDQLQLNINFTTTIATSLWRGKHRSMPRFLTLRLRVIDTFFSRSTTGCPLQ